LNGTFTTLASAPATVVTGRRYRLRLESIGTVHRVYLDDRQILTAYDSALTEGTAGLLMYRTAADFDNVIVSPSPFTSIYATDFAGENPGPANWRNLGDWQNVGGVYRQGSTSGSARSVIGPLTDDQIVQVRVRPLSFDGPDRWVGVLVRYEDDANYLYVTLRSSNRIALRRLINGQITEIASGLMTVTPGTWYTIRIEVVNNLTRVFVNDQLTFLTPASPGPAGPNPGGNKGRVGLVTYRATAEYDDFLAFQP
jgi:pectate lyase